jgi:hypothetical protein
MAVGRHDAARRRRRERKITGQNLIYMALTRTIEVPADWAILMSAGTQQSTLCDPEHNVGVPECPSLDTAPK